MNAKIIPGTKPEAPKFPTPAIAAKADAALAAYKKIKAGFMSSEEPVRAEAGSLLMQACRRGDLAEVRALIEKGADLPVTNNALTWAAEKGRTEIVALLIEHGANVTAMDHEALRRAAQWGHTETVALLIQHGADVTDMNHAALRWAVRWGHTETVSLLIQHGANVTAMDHEALRRAAQWGHTETVSLLLKHDRAGRSFLPEWAQKDLVQYDAQAERWLQVLRRDPLPHLWREDPALFKGTCYEAVCRILRAENYVGETAATMAFHTAALFQTPERVLQYLKQWGGQGRQPLHDLVQMIKVPSALPGGVRPNLKDWADGVLKCGPSMAKLVKFADRVPSPVKTEDGRTWSMVKTREECAKFSYGRAAQNFSLAAVCFEHSVDEKDFEKALAIVQAKQPANKNIPDLALTGEVFGMPGGTFRRLADGDVNGLFLGEMTDCCQSIGGAGAACATHGFTSENGGFYVVENARGRIVGQSWAWRGSEGELCLDSLETLGKSVTGDQWMGIVTAFRDAVAANNNHKVTALTIGTGGATGNSCPGLKSVFNDRVAAKPCDYDGYRDSNNQILVWRAPHV